MVFDTRVPTPVFGAAYQRIADATGSATMIRQRRDEWIEAGIFQHLGTAVPGGP
jgi:hypothetical protein